MPKPIHCILLIDDDPDDIFLHQVVINDSGLCDNIRVAENAKEALHYLTNTSHPDYIRPDLILTDVNLPGMNGFEFLEEYHHLDEQLKSRLAVLVFTTSLAPRDTQRAAMIAHVNGYYTKPLTNATLQTIVNQYVITSPNDSLNN
ncbi:response regulator [Spirosoma foliorum]|uniref:Response regulator n=1 Tax=Spirosoma foliorum TaxID=2710596 RepID=A0A7G5H558_9BACT|nr:response regulator [Spirosoma foliorum]QMW06250.1 response regulator [Spirosoma foliorum]